MSNWTDAIVGHRMTVDQQFTDRVQASQFSNAEWNLIMTATEFEIENADDPEAARLVANTDNVEAIIPELASVRSQTAAMGGHPTGSDGPTDRSGGGLLGSLKSALGFGKSDGGGDEGVDQEKLDAAERLAAAYAEQLQSHLVETDSFEQARRAYLDSAD